MIAEAFDIRSDSDYDDFYLVSKNDILVQMQNIFMKKLKSISIQL